MKKSINENKGLIIADVSGSYIGTQTPIERLRNKLTPFLTIVDLLERDENIVLPFVDNDFKNEIFEKCLDTCIGFKEDIKIHLSDCENFYNSDMLQCCYNYVIKQKDSDQKLSIIRELKNRGCL